MGRIIQQSNGKKTIFTVGEDFNSLQPKTNTYYVGVDFYSGVFEKKNPDGSIINLEFGAGDSITVVGGIGFQRTPTILRTSTNSSTVDGAYSVSFASVGTADAIVGGAILKPGETINFDAGAINNTLGSITYDSSESGAELLIITLT